MTDTREPVRFMTYNIRHGEGGDERVDLARIAAVIAAAAPDFVALQEVDRGTVRCGGVDQAAELARLTDMHMRFAKTLDLPGGGEYGIALLSRLPIRETRVHALPASTGAEPRCALAVRVTLPHATSVWAVCTHLDCGRSPTDSDRARQVAALLRLDCGTAAEPALLAGDLNAAPAAPEIEALAEQWTDCAAAPAAPTFPADAPTRRIDYSRCRPASRWRIVASSTVIDERLASDHRPVVATLTLRGNP